MGQEFLDWPRAIMQWSLAGMFVSGAALMATGAAAAAVACLQRWWRDFRGA